MIVFSAFCTMIAHTVVLTASKNSSKQVCEKVYYSDVFFMSYSDFTHFRIHNQSRLSFRIDLIDIDYWMSKYSYCFQLVDYFFSDCFVSCQKREHPHKWLKSAKQGQKYKTVFLVACLKSEYEQGRMPLEETYLYYVLLEAR